MKLIPGASIVLVIVIVMLGLTRAVPAPPPLSIAELGHPPADTTAGRPAAATAAHGPFRERSVLTDLGTRGGDRSDAQDINERGQVIGYSTTAAGARHAFLWERNIMTDLGTLGGINTGNAFAINERGQVAAITLTDTGPDRAVLWEKGTVTNLWNLRSYDHVAAINKRGQVAGTMTVNSYPDCDVHCVLSEKGSLTDLGTLDGRSTDCNQENVCDVPDSRRAINERGQVVGISPSDEPPPLSLAHQNGAVRPG